MKVRLKSLDGRVIAKTGQEVNPGETVDVPDDLGASLCEQTDLWEQVVESKVKEK